MSHVFRAKHFLGVVALLGFFPQNIDGFSRGANGADATAIEELAPATGDTSHDRDLPIKHGVPIPPLELPRPRVQIALLAHQPPHATPLAHRVAWPRGPPAAA